MTTWSKYQDAVFDFANNGLGNGAVEAVAGSGKTSTGIEMVQRFAPTEQGLFTSFTRTIVQELDTRIKTLGLRNITAKTYNAFGAGLIYRNMRPAPKLLTEYNGQKTDIIFRDTVMRGARSFEDKKMYAKCKPAILRMVGLLKSLAVLTVQEASNRFDDIVEYYDIELPKEPRFKELLFGTYAESLRRTDIIDYDDQKLFPLLFRWTVPQFDFLVIDEFQDTCPVESQLMLSACKHGRIIVFGDRNQAIYSFKGTTPDSMQEFAEKHSARLLPLSICYRCPKAVIREAQKIVPQIEWADDAIEGAVNTITKSKYKQTCTARDIVLARTTDDLVKSVIGFLAEGRAAYVEGREYGTQLKWFVEKHSDNQDNMDAETFKSRMDVHFSETHPELLKYNKEAQALALETKVDTIDVLIVGCQTVGDLRKKIDSIFTDKGVGIRHMTVHKSKGLQGNVDGDVHILRPDKLPHPRAKKPHLKEEERRLKYVAQTRTRRSLFYVQKDENEK